MSAPYFTRLSSGMYRATHPTERRALRVYKGAWTKRWVVRIEGGASWPARFDTLKAAKHFAGEWFKVGLPASQ